MHINLISQEEQRSASLVSPMLGLKLFGIIFLVLGLVWGVSFTTRYRALQNQTRASEDEWERTEPKYKAALQLRGDLAGAESLLKELKIWRDSEPAWSTQLENLRSIVPSVIQLTDLRVSQTILSISNTITARAFEMRLSGKTAAPRSEANVTQFLEGFKQPVFTPAVESATLPPGAFRQDPISKTDRVFEIVCKFSPRPLE